ncbi:hypothetical protein EDE12_105150 [Methylosinus sp. sav-2]|nr:hypothetical protein EDE12_105150 [Methylosinus sp. sav-2]
MGESARLVVCRGAGAHKKRPRCSLSKVQRALPRDEIERGERPGPAVGRVLDENLRKGKGAQPFADKEFLTYAPWR